LKERWKGQEDEEEDVSCYSMILREGEVTESLKRTHQSAIFKELAMEGKNIVQESVSLFG
jgi:hypothetical protein